MVLKMSLIGKAKVARYLSIFLCQRSRPRCVDRSRGAAAVLTVEKVGLKFSPLAMLDDAPQ